MVSSLELQGAISGFTVTTRNVTQMDDSGTLYGTTDLGGIMTDPFGFGTVFKLTPLDEGKTTWQETVLYRFTSVADGQNPMFTLTLDATGALYGTTLNGGVNSCGTTAYSTCGTVFTITTSGAESLVHSFGSGTDGVVTYRIKASLVRVNVSPASAPASVNSRELSRPLPALMESAPGLAAKA